MYLLDTNVVSELRKAKAAKADPRVTAWAAETPAASLFLSVVTIQELEIGVLLAERRDPPQGAILRTWLEDRAAQCSAPRSRSAADQGRSHRGDRARSRLDGGDAQRQRLCSDCSKGPRPLELT